MNEKPIFLHSLFRSASTYFFDKFRSLGTDFSAYQEPFHEYLIRLNDPLRHAELLKSPDSLNNRLRHPSLEKPYLYEFWLIRDRLAGLFRTEFAYEQYFAKESEGLPEAQHAYLSAILDNSTGRPVLQFCRSSGRVGALRRAFGGMHIHLWREPRAQWWSYKVEEYFDRVTQRIYRGVDVPKSLQKVREAANCNGDQFQLLSARDNYAIFYGVWLDAWLSIQEQTELEINVDTVGRTEGASQQAALELAKVVGKDFDLSDFRARGMRFARDEEAYYSSVEHSVEEIFLSNERCEVRDIERARAAAELAREAHTHAPGDSAAEESLRRVALDLMDKLAWKRTGRRHRWWDPRKYRFRGN